MGIYAACYKLGVFMSLYILAFKLGAEPFFFNQASEKNAQHTYARILNWFVLCGALLMIVIVGFIDDFAALLLGSESYFQALVIVPVILLANLFLGVYYNLSIWFKLTDKTRYGMYFSLVGAVVTIGMNLVLIPKIGYMASALATVSAYGLMAILSYFYGRKHYPVPYQVGKNLLFVLIAVVACLVSFEWFRGNRMVSMAMVILFLGMAFWQQRNEIKEIWKI